MRREEIFFYNFFLQNRNNGKNICKFCDKFVRPMK